MTEPAFRSQDRRLSDAITLARPVLILLMCLAHLPNIESFLSSQDSYQQLSTLVPVYIKDFLARGPVPILSVISGYLAYASFCKAQPYKRFIQGKAKRLCVPFLIWNLIALALLSLIARYLGLDIRGLPANPGAWDYINGLLGITRVPFDAPTYFLRDLFLLMLALPLIHYISQNIYRLIAFTLLIVGIFHSLPAIVIPLNDQGLLLAIFYRWDTPIFFTVGYALALQQRTLFHTSLTSELLITLSLALLGLGFSMALSYFAVTAESFPRWRAALGAAFILTLPWLLNLLLRSKDTWLGHALKRFSPYSFMVFLSHGPFSMLYSYLTTRLLSAPVTEHSPLWLQGLYTLFYLIFVSLIAIILLTLWRRTQAKVFNSRKNYV